ncbi:MAG: hypothetical protein IPM39_11775 [Chloroflexi bacterium]|nr:hypothetical protein [Chloroflexota bacterium]
MRRCCRVATSWSLNKWDKASSGQLSRSAQRILPAAAAIVGSRRPADNSRTHLA